MDETLKWVSALERVTALERDRTRIREVRDSQELSGAALLLWAVLDQ